MPWPNSFRVNHISGGGQTPLLIRVLDGKTDCDGRRMNAAEPGSLMRGSPGSPPTRGRVDEEKVRQTKQVWSSGRLSG